MFALHDSVTEREATAALQPAMLSELLSVGLLVREESGRLVSPFEIKILDGLLLLCDDLAGGQQAVFGTGPGTMALCHAIPRRASIGDALDIGCGAGAVALWLARTTRRVIATDINPRAITFVKVNAALNHISNIETRVGDLFKPVHGMTFDCITAQMPFIPDPGVANPALYRFGGRYGNELTRRLQSDLHRHLTPEGFAIIVCLEPTSDNTGSGELVSDPQVCHAGNISSLVLLGAEIDADTFSFRYARMEPQGGAEETIAAASRMRDHLDHYGVRGVCPAVWRVERANSSIAWTELIQVSADLWEDVSSADVERIYEAMKLTHSGTSALLRARLRLPDGALLFQSLMRDPKAIETVFLGLVPHRMVRPLELSQPEWKLIQSVDSAHDVKTAIDSLSEPPGPQRDRNADLATICRLLRGGLFDIASTP
jgi:SAM-dependent methyltransferase